MSLAFFYADEVGFSRCAEFGNVGWLYIGGGGEREREKREKEMGQHGKKMEMGARMEEPLMGPSLQRTEREREREKREEMLWGFLLRVMKAGDDDGCAVHSGETFARTARLYGFACLCDKKMMKASHLIR